MKDMTEYHGLPGVSAPMTGHKLNPPGRFPAHLVLSCNCPDQIQHELDCAVRMLDEQSGFSRSTDAVMIHNPRLSNANYGHHRNKCHINKGHADSGGASRFFYCAKASSRERRMGLDGMMNFHPTIKAIKLMSYLCRLITPPGGIVLDPFMGSGSTGIAAHQEGFDFIGIEKEVEYFNIAKKRLDTLHSVRNEHGT